MAAGVMLSVECDDRILPVDRAVERVLEVTVAASGGDRRAPRAARAPALVLACRDDAGRRAGAAAAARLQQTLAPGELLAVTTVAASETALVDAWFDAGSRLASAPERAALVAFVTDGLPTRADADLAPLALRARQLCQVGVSTAAFCIGPDSDIITPLLLAEQGGGAFHMLASPDALLPALLAEVDDLAGVIATDSLLTVTAPPGAAVYVLGDVPHERLPTGVQIALGQLRRGEARRLYLCLALTAGGPGALSITADVMMRAFDGEVLRACAEQTLRPGPLTVAPSRRIRAAAARVETAAVTATALALERAGRRHQAEAMLRDALRRHAAALDGADYAAGEALAAALAGGLRIADRNRACLDAYQARRG